MQNDFKIGDLVLIKDTGFFGLERGGLAGQVGIVTKIYEGYSIYTSEVVHVYLEDGITRGFYYYELKLLARNEQN